MFSMLIMHINMFVDVKHGTVMVSHAKTGFFTARCSYVSTVLGVVILSICHMCAL